MRLLSSEAMPAAPRPAPPPALLADIGGTHARFALAGADAAQPLLADSVRTFLVDDFDSLAAAAGHYLRDVGARPTRAVMAVAARIDGDTARMTNHRWVVARQRRSEEHTSELQSLMRISYAVFCLKKKTTIQSASAYHY